MSEMDRAPSKVAVVRCDSYDRDKVTSAVREGIELLGGFDCLFADAVPNWEELGKDAEILLKPNLLSRAAPEKAVTTHPEVFRAVGELLHEAGYSNLAYGDSPGNPANGMSKVAEASLVQIMDVRPQWSVSPLPTVRLSAVVVWLS